MIALLRMIRFGSRGRDVKVLKCALFAVGYRKDSDVMFGFGKVFDVEL